MKRATRRALEKWIVPGIVGGVVGGIVGYLSAGPEGDGITLLQMQVLVAGGILTLALTAYDLWRSDEMERQIYFVAMTLAFLGTGLVVLVYGLLQMMGYPELNWGVVFLVQVVFYAAGWWGAWIRYR